MPKPRMKWWGYVLYFTVLCVGLVFTRALWRGRPTDRDGWLDNVKHALFFAVPYVTLQLVSDRHRAKRMAEALRQHTEERRR